MGQILPPGEFEGTALDAPKRRPRPGDDEDRKKWNREHGIEDSDEESSEEEDDYEYVDGHDFTVGRGGMPPIREESSVSKSKKKGEDDSDTAKKSKSLQFSRDDDEGAAKG